MNRTELTLAIAGALLAAVVVGWLLRWMFSGLAAGGSARLRDAAELADRMHLAEADRARAERRLGEIEADCAARLRELEAELGRTQSLLDAAQAEVEEVRAAYRRSLADGAPPAG